MPVCSIEQKWSQVSVCNISNTYQLSNAKHVAYDFSFNYSNDLLKYSYPNVPDKETGT